MDIQPTSPSEKRLTEKPLNDSEEFWCIWFESHQAWRVILSDGKVSPEFGAIGYATQFAMSACGRGESQWYRQQMSGDSYHFFKDPEYWEERIS